MRNVRIGFFISLIFLTGALRSEEAPATLPDLLKEAEQRNPEVKSAFQKWKVMDKEAGAASVWPNPKISYVDEKDPSGEEGVEPMTRKHYGVSQDVPFPGKLTNDAKMKHHESLIAEADFRGLVLDVDRQVKIAYYRLVTLDQLIDLANESVESMRRTLSTTQSRLAANQGMTSDVFMAQMELRRVENMAFEKSQERKSVEIELNTLLDYPIERAWPMRFPGPAWRELTMGLEQLENLAAENNPRFESARHEMNHSRAMLSRSKLEYLPDLGFMYEYQTAGDGARGTGPAGRQLGVSLSVPLWLKRPIDLTAGANAHLLEADAAARSMTNMIRKMVAMERNEIVTHAGLVKKIEDGVLPAAKGALNITRQQYAAGRGDFLRLLEANRAWIQAHVEYQEQLFHVYEHWSELERWVGTDLPVDTQEKSHEK